MMDSNWKDIEQQILSFYRGNPAIMDPWGAKIDDRHVSRYFSASRARFHLLADQVAKLASSGANVLEVGAAYGAVLLYLQIAGYNVSACELPECIRAYSGVLLKANIPVTPWDIHRTDCPAPPNSCDVVIASDVLEHLQVSLQSAIRKLAQPLAQGGALIVTTPNLYNMPNLLRIMKGINIAEPFADEPVYKNGVVVDNRTHPREPTMSELVAGMRACGLQVVEARYFNSRTKLLANKIAYSILPRRIRHHLLVVGRRP